MAKRTPPYQVGYGRPPRETRFEPGVSGNPKGRPKGSISVSVTLHRLLKEEVVITENGRKKKVSKFEASIKQLIRLAYSGNMQAMKQMITLVGSIEQRAEEQMPKEKSLGRTERKMLQNIVKRFENAGREGAHE